MKFAVTEHVSRSPRHATHYLSCGDADAPLIVFVHGWPELSISWRHQLRCFAHLGFRVRSSPTCAVTAARARQSRRPHRDRAATGHWMSQERPELVNAGLARWLGRKFPNHWNPLAKTLTR